MLIGTGAEIAINQLINMKYFLELIKLKEVRKLYKSTSIFQERNTTIVVERRG